jgi:CheY-like chemotaxis protein
MPEPHTILIVEDNEDDVFLMRRALKSAGILNPVQLMEDGQRGIDYLRGTGEFSDRTKYPYPRVVFLDLQLPHKSGFDVLHWLESSGLERPLVVVLTSSNSPHDRARCAELGAAFYAVKPPDACLFELLRQDFGVIWKLDESDPAKFRL